MSAPCQPIYYNATAGAATAQSSVYYFDVPNYTQANPIPAYNVQLQIHENTGASYPQGFRTYTQMPLNYAGETNGIPPNNYATGTQYIFNQTLTTGTMSWSVIEGKAYKLKDALMKVFQKPDKKLWKELTEDEKKMFKAKQASEKLLKSWLSVEEYKGLKIYGEIEVPSKVEDDCIYIVKRDPHAMVEVMKDGHYKHKLCVIAKDGDMPIGDQLLSKLLLLKTDEAKFRTIAIKHP